MTVNDSVLGEYWMVDVGHISVRPRVDSYKAWH